MSMHLVECAARLNLPPSTKLALMAFADSADRVTRIALPGLEHVQQWSTLGRSRCSEVVADLVDLGYLQKHRGGTWGRRAEYVVFPQGCCEAHAPLPEDTTGSDTPDPYAPENPASGTADPDTLTDSGTPDPTNPDPSASGTADTRPAIGSDTGSDSYRTPSETSTTPRAGVGAQPQTARPPSPHPPDRDEHGPLVSTCPEHRDTTDPPACRRCASWRERFDRAELARTAATRRADGAQLIAESRRARHDTADVDRDTHLARVRSQLRPTGARQ